MWQRDRSMISCPRPIAGALASRVLLSLASGLFSWLVGPLFQFVFQGGNMAPDALRRALPFLDPARVDRAMLLRALPVLILCIALARGAAYFGQFFAMGMLGQRVVADLRLRLHQKL